tara:strand:+ start:7510 stop:7719 length:210 start_codon:yes stop_codon:yes gene_type:complete
MNNLNSNTILLMKAVAELRRQGLEPREHLRRWVNLCTALTNDLEDHFCERSNQVEIDCTVERRKLLKAG